MIIVISPAKTLDFEPINVGLSTSPSFLDESKVLIGELQEKEPKDIASLMSLSDKLATLNYDRYQNWEGQRQLNSNAKQAMFVFQGDVYKGLEADTFNEEDIEFSQKHLRILSGLYGSLKPLDVVEPYRLEMGTKLLNPKGKNLYEFWGEKITDMIVKEISENGSNTLINLASEEYFKSLSNIKNKINVISPIFKDYKNGKFKIISFYAKKARGLMAKYIIKNQITDPKDLIDFDLDGYKFFKSDSTIENPVFHRKL